MPSFRGKHKGKEELGDWAEEAGRRDNWAPETAFQPIARIPRRGMLAPLPGYDRGVAPVEPRTISTPKSDDDNS